MCVHGAGMRCARGLATRSQIEAWRLRPAAGRPPRTGRVRSPVHDTAPHFRQALQCSPRGAHTGPGPWAWGLLWPPLSDLDLPAFGRFGSMITARAGQTASHGSCRALSSMQHGPAAAIAAARPSAFGIHETEAAEIGESASAHHHSMRWVYGRPQIVESWKWRRAQLWIGFHLQYILSNAVHPTAAPPFAHTSMSSLPSSFSRRCSYARAGISSTAQHSYLTAPRELRGAGHGQGQQGGVRTEL